MAAPFTDPVIETALRQNPTCDVQAVVDAIVAGDVAQRNERFRALDLEPRADALPPTLTIATGSTNPTSIVPGCAA